MNIDTSRKIKEVSFFVYDNKQFNGIRIKDDQGEVVAYEQWKPSNYKCEWVTHEVPSGKEIIGLYVKIR